MKLKCDVTPFLQKLKNTYYLWQWERKERKTKLYDVNSKFITYACHGGFIHSSYHFAKRIIDCGPVIGNPDFNALFQMNVKYGCFFPIKKELIK